MWDNNWLRIYWASKIFALASLAGIMVGTGSRGFWPVLGWVLLFSVVLYEIIVWNKTREDELAKLAKGWRVLARVAEAWFRMSLFVWIYGVLSVLVLPEFSTQPGLAGEIIETTRQVGDVLVYVGLVGLLVGFGLAGLVLRANRKVGFYCEHQERDRPGTGDEPREGPLSVGREPQLHSSVQKPSSIWDAGYAGSGRTRRYLGD